MVRRLISNLYTSLRLKYRTCVFAAVPLATGLTSTFENGFETVAGYNNGSYVPRQAPPFGLQSQPTSSQSPPINANFQSAPVMPPNNYTSQLRVQAPPSMLQSPPTMVQSPPPMLQFPPPMLQSTPPTQYSASPMPYAPRADVQSSQPLPELIPRVMTSSEMPR